MGYNCDTAPALLSKDIISYDEMDVAVLKYRKCKTSIMKIKKVAKN